QMVPVAAIKCSLCSVRNSNAEGGVLPVDGKKLPIEALGHTIDLPCHPSATCPRNAIRFQSGFIAIASAALVFPRDTFHQMSWTPRRRTRSDNSFNQAAGLPKSGTALRRMS